MFKGEIRNPVTVLLLGFVTCGIYYLYWIYKVSEEVQNYNGNVNETMSPAVELLLCIFTCNIYLIYWHYKYSKLIAESQQMAGLTPDDNSVVALILVIFGLAPVSGMIIQGSLNKLWEQT